MISQVSRCAWTTRRGSRGLEWAGKERDVRPRPRAICRTRTPAVAMDVQHAAGTPNILRASTSRGVSIRPGARTQHPSGRPCRPSKRLNSAMEHTDSMERHSEYLEHRRRYALVRDLTEPDRALLEARIVDGWDYPEIARRLGIPRADLVRRVHRIRADLRRKAKALGAGETKLDIAATRTV